MAEKSLVDMGLADEAWARHLVTTQVSSRKEGILQADAQGRRADGMLAAVLSLFGSSKGS